MTGEQEVENKMGEYSNPVSYTHLDVYKRQFLDSLLIMIV